LTVCVYTSVFGGFDDLKPPPSQTIACDWVCFTDEPDRVTVAPWRGVLCDEQLLPGAEVRMRSRLLKAMSHRAMRELGAEYDFTIWNDASIRVLRSTFVERFVDAASASGMALVRHPERDCIYDEVEASLRPGTAHKYARGRIREQVEHYRAEGYPAHNGLLACGTIARDMRNDDVRRIDEAWWEEIRRWSVHDQLSLPYVLWRLGLEAGVVEMNQWRNPLFEVMPHLELGSGGEMRLARAEYSAREFRAAAGGDRLGTYAAGLWRLPAVELSFGPSDRDMIPLVGDWDGDGVDSPGLYDPATGSFFLRNSCTPGPADLSFTFGPPGALPVVGDWSGEGRDSIGVYLPGEGHCVLRARPEPGPADISFDIGSRDGAMMAVAGDWDGTGRDRVGLYHPEYSTWFLLAENRTGAAVETFDFGPNAGVPIVGDWDGDGADEVGVYVVEQGQAFLADENRAGTACSRALVEPPGAWPLAVLCC
jgi:hypothetical protein